MYFSGNAAEFSMYGYVCVFEHTQHPLWNNHL